MNSFNVGGVTSVATAIYRSLNRTEFEMDFIRDAQYPKNEIDEEVQKSLQSGDDLATEIQQLFIDIQANDANDLQIWVDNNPGVAPPTNITNTRIKRFKNAFSTIFTKVSYQ